MAYWFALVCLGCSCCILVWVCCFELVVYYLLLWITQEWVLVLLVFGGFCCSLVCEFCVSCICFPFGVAYFKCLVVLRLRLLVCVCFMFVCLGCSW